MWINSYYKRHLASDDEKTEATYQALLQENPNDNNALVNLMVHYSNTKQIEKAYRYGEIMLAKTDRHYTDTGIYHHWGRLELFQKNFEKAIEWYEKALTGRHHNFDHIHYEMGGCYEQLENYAYAEYHYVQAIAYSRKESDRPCQFWDALGLLYAKLERYEEAIEIFKEREVGSPDLWETKYYLGLCYQRLGDDLRALAYYFRVIQMPYDVPEVYNNAAVLFHNVHGNIRQALRHICMAEEVSDDHEANFQLIWQNYHILEEHKGLVQDYDWWEEEEDFILAAEHIRPIQACGFELTYYDDGEDYIYHIVEEEE